MLVNSVGIVMLIESPNLVNVQLLMMAVIAVLQSVSLKPTDEVGNALQNSRPVCLPVENTMS